VEEDWKEGFGEVMEGALKSSADGLGWKGSPSLEGTCSSTDASPGLQIRHKPH
jgi:hypothetical protein